MQECKQELSKEPHIIVGTPGRVLDMISKRFLYTNDIKLLIFDEADEMLSYGFQETIYGESITKIILINGFKKF